MDRFAAMSAFVRVVEAGSLSGAARALHLGQPAVSKIVAGLEAQLGVRLLNRSTRKLSPTEAGQRYYERALRALSEVAEAEFAARGAGAALEGRLRVCAPVTFARLHLVPRLGAFFATHPRMQLEFVLDDRLIDLVEEGLDLGLRMGALADSSMTAQRLGTGERLVVASPAYLAAHGAPQTPADLTAHDVIVYAQTVSGDKWQFRKGTAEASVQMKGRLVVTAAEGLREAVLAGLGCAIGSNWMFAPELESCAVVPLLTDWTMEPLTLWAIYPSGRMPTAKARAFAAFVGGLLADILTE